MPEYTMILNERYAGASTFANTIASICDDLGGTAGPGNAVGQIPGEMLWVTDQTYMLGFRYVKLATSLGALVVNAPMYFTDATKSVVNSDPTKAETYVASTDSAVESAAGLLMNATTPAQNTTNTAPVAGNGVWVQTAGYLAAITAPSGSNLGDRLVLSNAANTAPTINVFTRVAAGTAPGTPEAIGTLYVVPLNSITAGVINGWVKGTCALP